VVASSKTENERGFFTLRSGLNIFYQIWKPDVEVKAAVLLLHGFGEHSDLSMAHKAKVLCSLGPFVTVAFDMPGHGRSDGLAAHIPDWLDFVDQAREVFLEHLRPLLLERWKGLKIFGLGESMGGGVLFTLLAREKELFDGAILVCPMLFVSRDLFPPWIVLQLFKQVLAPLLPLWPITPTKDLADVCNCDPQMRTFYNVSGAGLHHQIAYKAKARLQTGAELAFVAGEWMRCKIPEYDVPSLIIHGGADAVTDHKVSRELFAGMRHADKEFLYPSDVWHADIFHGGPRCYEACKERFQAVAHWIEERCS